MGLYERDYMRGRHPPYCTCTNCCMNWSESGKKFHSIVGIYEQKHSGEFQILKFLESGIIERWLNGKKHDGFKWEVKRGRVLSICAGVPTVIYRIESNGDLTMVAVIDAQHNFIVIPRDFQSTLKRVKNHSTA